MSGPEVWESIITPERASKGDLKLTHRTNAANKKTFITHAEPVKKPLVVFLISQDALYPEAEQHAARFMDMRRAFLAPCGHGFNRIYFTADEWRGEGGGSLEEAYTKARRFIGRENERLVIQCWETTTQATRLRELPRHLLAMSGSFRDAFRALHDAFKEMDSEKKKDVR